MANIDGTTGNDVLSGTSADDVITGFEGDDDLNGVGGNDTILGGSGTNVLSGGSGNDLLYVDGVDDIANGNENDDTVHVGFYLGAATILGGGIAGASGTDSLIFHDATFDSTSASAAFSSFESVSGTINGTAGNDELWINLLFGAGIEASLLTINGGDGDDFVAASSETDVMHGGGGNDQFLSGFGNDTLYGDDGDDELDGGEGNNTLYGGNGNDELVAGSGGDVLYSGSGTNYLSAGYGDDSLYADGVDDIVNGSLGDDIVHIGSLTGAATILGGAINGGSETDSLIFYGATFDATSGSASFAGFESVSGTLNSTSGNDVLNLSGLTHAGLSAFTLTLDGGDGNDTITGGAEFDTIIGGLGNDILSGGVGSDAMLGGTGNDLYTVDSASDSVTEDAAAGTDEIRTALASYSIAALANVEKLTGTSAAGQTLTGNAGANTLTGLGGNDTLVGGLGADTMSGGLGNDFFYVDSAGDVVLDGGGSGSDRIFASVTYAMGAAAYVELLTTTNNAGTAAINLSGNTFSQTIYGNAGANLLDGKGGDDTLTGLAGNDTLVGGLGADTLIGGLGDDSYYVDNTGDVVIEAVGQGTADRIFASASYTLGAGVEIERLTTDNNAGTAAINLTGSGVANVIYGNAGANVLDGRGGADTLVGLGGNDSFYVDHAGDVVSEAAGGGTADRIFASVSYAQGAGVHVEQLTTTNNAGTTAINLTGNELANTIYGNAGVNVLDGKGGADLLVGLQGADTFAFTTALGAGNIDAISGFVVADDTIRLENAVFTGLAAGALATGAFNTGAAASQADDRVIYNSATGALLFDADGLGGAAAVQFATLAGGLALTSADFLVV